MGLFTPGKRVQHRRFSYEPRFYDPQREERIKRRIQIQRRARRRSPAGLVYFALLLAVVLYFYLKLG